MFNSVEKQNWNRRLELVKQMRETAAKIKVMLISEGYPIKAENDRPFSPEWLLY